jgi:hypothetical protein
MSRVLGNPSYNVFVDLLLLSESSQIFRNSSITKHFGGLGYQHVTGVHHLV